MIEKSRRSRVNTVRMFSRLGEVGQGRISELEAQVLSQRRMYRRDLGETLSFQSQKIEHPRSPGIGHAVEGPVLVTKDPGGFGQHGPAREKRRRERSEGPDAEAMVSVVLGEEGNEGAGIEKDAALSHARNLPCTRGWC